MLLPRAKEHPDETAIDDLNRRRSWRELSERSSRGARLLRDELGLACGEHAAILMGNRVEYVELVLAAIEAGIWITPINRHSAAEEIAYVVSNSGARVVFADDEHAELAVRASGGARVIVCGAQIEQALARQSDQALPIEGRPGATMIYTSGTTGRPKGVMRALPASVGASLERMRQAGAALGLDGAGPHLITGPLYHAAPLLFAIYDLVAGAPMVIMPRWDEQLCLELIDRQRVRHTHLVPTMFVRLLRLPQDQRRRFDGSSLELVLHGAAPVSESVKRQMIDWWGPIFVEYWGATEGGYCTLVDSADWLVHPGTVGRATDAFEVFATDETGDRLPSGEIGTLYCRHKRLDRPFEYHTDAAKTAAAYLADGSFTTGDMGWVDTEGYVYLTDRRSNMIISGGVNIYPAEIEAVLQEHPAVADVCVFGIPDDEWGESVKAAIELCDGAASCDSLALEILDFARTRLAGYKVPRSIDFTRELPRQPSGKILTRVLREPYWQGRPRRI